MARTSPKTEEPFIPRDAVVNEKRLNATLDFHVTTADGAPFMDARVTYHNLKESGLVMIEGGLVRMLQGFNDYAESKLDE